MKTLLAALQGGASIVIFNAALDQSNITLMLAGAIMFLSGIVTATQSED